MATDSEWEALARERCCVHCRLESRGAAYAGRDYLRGLQALRGGEAMSIARKVEPFFWSDAAMTTVRLCENCRERLGLRAEPELAAPPFLSADRASEVATGLNS